MIAFRPMSETDYPAYLAYFIPDYAAEIAANYGVSQADALEQARRAAADDLPQGVATPGECLVCILDDSDETVLGYLWYRPDAAGRSVFIMDFHILDAHQGRGLGKQALAHLEEHLAKTGFRQIKLRVAGDNERARHVYATTGFRVTGINMSKAIGEKG